MELAGQDLTNYFPVPLTQGCPGLVDQDFKFQYANFTPLTDYAVHTSGSLQTIENTQLNNERWYWDRFHPTIGEYYKGKFVYSKKDIQQQGEDSGR